MSDASKKELPRTGMRRKGTVSGKGHAGYAKKMPAPEQVRHARRGDNITASSPLSERMVECLLAMLALHGGDDYYRPKGRQYPATPNEVALQAGYSEGGYRRGNGAAARGGWSGRMAPANRVNFALLGLEDRGMLWWGMRRDHLSGRAVSLTREGFDKAVQLRREKAMADGHRTDVGEADGDVEAVWIVEGYDPENLTPVKASEVMYAPGTTVMFSEDHEMYADEEGIVQAVGTGTGAHAGEVMYDVLVEGTSEAERVSEHEVST